MSEKEFITIIESHIVSLRENAFRFTKNIEDANDLVQDTLFKAIRFYGTFEQETNLKAWLFVIMKNTFINDCRRKAKKQSLIDQDDNVKSAQLLYSAEHNKCISNMIISDVHKILDKIPNAYRIPFVRYVEGYKYLEIAKQQNIPLGTVKTRIHVARVLLRDQLKIYSIA